MSVAQQEIADFRTHIKKKYGLNVSIRIYHASSVPPLSKFNEVVEATCSVMGVSKEDITKQLGCRSLAKIALARKIIMYTLSDYNYSVTQLSMLLNVHYGTVSKQIISLENLLQVKDEYTTGIYTKVLEKLIT
jgi:hypothetical protein